MFEAMGSMENAAALEASSAMAPPPLPGGSSEPEDLFQEPPSAVIAPSSQTQKSSPKTVVKQKEFDPSSVDTGKDTQCLVVDEDDSEC